MGYEIKAFVVRATGQEQEFVGQGDSWYHSWVDEDGISYYYCNGVRLNHGDPTIKLNFSIKLAEFYFGTIGKNPSKQEAGCYIYDSDGNTPIIVDRYGEKLTECSLQYAYDYFNKNDILSINTLGFLAYTETLLENFYDQDIRVLFYGY